jgi:hypothetical protein
MKKNRGQISILFAFVFSVFLVLDTEEKGVSEVIELCDFKVPKTIANANTSFNVIYLINIGRDGKPSNIVPIKNDFLDNNPFIECIKGWELLPQGGPYTAIFHWQHGQGWDTVSIKGKETNRLLKFRSGWCCSIY